jgi:hypothetical protein
MNGTLMLLDRAAVRYAVVALSATLLAACDSDQPLAPKNTEVPTTANPALLIKTGTLLMKAVDQNWQVITTSKATYKVVGPNQTTWVVTDNSQPDSDPATGVVQMPGMIPGWYNVCETTPPAEYSLPDPPCVPVMVLAGGTFGKWFVHAPVGRVKWGVEDFIPNYIGGGVFTLKDSVNNTIAIINDNSTSDADPAPGKFDVKLFTQGSYTLCETAPPPGYVFPTNQIVFCFPVQIKNGQTTQLPNFLVYPIASAYWQVTDGVILPNSFYNLIGPSTFKVTSAAGAGSFDVVDNGVNDMDPGLGKIAVKVPVVGLYSICETVPPIGHWNAKPACKRITVVNGVPAWAEFFINPEAQVPSAPG